MCCRAPLNSLCSAQSLHLYTLGEHVHKYLRPTKGLVASAYMSTGATIKPRLGLTPNVLCLKKDVVPVAHEQEGWVVS